MTKQTRSPTGDPTAAFVSWLVTGAVGPALVALPVNLVADKLTGAAVRWFKRLRKTDDLSRLVKTAADSSVDLNDNEFKALRKLLEKEQTWNLLAGGKLNEKVWELTGKIADCLPPRDSRTPEDARQAAGAIARGLLEFAVHDLQPEIFQKVVLARLQQMADQASALDEAVFRMHKDLYHLVEEVNDLFKLVSDRLTTEPADLNEIRIYLRTLIGWLNSDPWPHDPRLGGPVLTPATIERKLRVSATRGPHELEQEQEIDADELARRCSRLVILGGPGSGKTWLAMRTVRICAEEALAGLDGKAALDEVELPLYTTCSRLVSTRGDIRQAAASSAIERIGDLGGSRIVKALCLFFTERATRTLLVIDSLDEASDAGEARERLRQADSLRQPWRVVLTSRRSSWSDQLNIEEGNQDHRVGELRSLHYPDDVEYVIQQWFAARPEQGQALTAQIARRSNLQQAATVPLILAFYCILGGGQSLPEFRHELYKKVINRMLHSPWRSGGSSPPYPKDCRAALRTWAWQGAKNHPVSGVGQWEDEIPAEPAELSHAGQIAVDHVAPPRGGPDFDTDKTLRRFVHRSIREHLVAEYIVGMSADEAAGELMKHLWYDPDWEYAAPAALAMHRERDQVLWELIRRVTGDGQLAVDLAQIDGCWEIRRFLARVAQESGEGDWRSEGAEMIGQARLNLATARPDDLPLVVASDWPTSNALIIKSLLAPLAGESRPATAGELAAVLPGLEPSAEERARAREILLNLLTYRWEARALVDALDRLDPSAEDRTRASETLLNRLTHPWEARALVDALDRLDPSAEDRTRARKALLSLLARGTLPGTAEELGDALARLAVTADERARARETLLSLLTRGTDPSAAGQMAGALARLDPSAKDRTRARKILLDLLTRRNTPGTAADLAAALAWLEPLAEERATARDALLSVLTRWTDPLKARRLAVTLARLGPPAHDRMKARKVLLVLLTQGTDPRRAGMLADALTQLAPPAEDREWARSVLFGLLSHKTAFERAGMLPDALARLAGTAEERAQARKVTLSLLTDGTDPGTALMLADALGRLQPSAEEQARARGALLSLLRDPEWARELTEELVQMDPSAEERAQAREALLGLLSRRADPGTAATLAEALAQLEPATEDRTQTRKLLLDLLTRGTDSRTAEELADSLAEFSPTVADLGGSDDWPFPPTPELLAAVRQNSEQNAWLAALPLLSVRSPQLS